MKSKNNETTINGKSYKTKSNSRGNQVYTNGLWYYYKQDHNNVFSFKRMIALWVETEDGKKRITKETKWLSNITSVNNEVDAIRVDFRRGEKIYMPRETVSKVIEKIPTYKDAYLEVCKDEKKSAIETGKDYGYKKIVSHHNNYVDNNKSINILKMKVKDITIADVKKLKNSINNYAITKGRSKKTVTLIFGSIDKVLRYCYEKNYTERLIHDVPITAKGSPSKKIGNEGFLTKDQFDYLLNIFKTDLIISKFDNPLIKAYRNKLYYTALNFLFYSGVRKAELYGMKWGDIRGNKFKVERSLNAVALYARTDGKAYREVEPKTSSGIREQTIPNTLRTILLEWKDTCISYGLKANNGDYIFLEANGIHFADTTFNRIFNKIIKESGVEEKFNKNINVHSLRHSACSYLVTEMKKKDPEATLYDIEDSVGQYLGHSIGGSMVREIYNHYYTDEEDSLLDQVLQSI